MDVVVTVPKNFRHPAAPGKQGLAAWLAEGDAPGTEWSGQLWVFSTWGARPSITPGERVYVVCQNRLVGYAPLVKLRVGFEKGSGPIEFIRGGGAVAVTLPREMMGFRGWKYRWWDRSEETPIELLK